MGHYFGHWNKFFRMAPFQLLLSLYPGNLSKISGIGTLASVQKKPIGQNDFSKVHVGCFCSPWTKFWTAYKIWFKILKQHFWCAIIHLLQIFYFIFDGLGSSISILKCGLFSRNWQISGQLMISKIGIMLGVAQLGGHRLIFGSPWSFYANKKNWWTTCFWIWKLETALDPKNEKNNAWKMSVLKQWNVLLFWAIATF